jgi:integrase/recombinase XerD
VAQGADAAGLGAEVANLKGADVNSRRMLLRIEQGIGRKDRFAKLPERLFELLGD